MHAMTRPLRALLVAAGFLASSAALATPVVFFGENQAPNGGVSGAPVTAHDAFLARLYNVQGQGFESLAVGTGTPTTLGFAGSNGQLDATLHGAGSIVSATGVGRYNTTAGGANFVEVLGDFSISFSQGISAFGFYATDIGDFGGQITLGLLGGGTTTLSLDSLNNGADGALLFFGFIDSAATYTSITFNNTRADDLLPSTTCSSPTAASSPAPCRNRAAPR